jgi:hypothetical protein
MTVPKMMIAATKEKAAPSAAAHNIVMDINGFTLHAALVRVDVC